MNDEQQIRDLVQTWMDATKNGDIEKVLSLMADDVVFLVAGQEPFGKEMFKKAAEDMTSGANSVQYEGKSTIEEVKILGEWAFARARLEVSTTPPDSGMPTHRSGYSLTIFHKETDGKWKLARDANLLTVDQE